RRYAAPPARTLTACRRRAYARASPSRDRRSEAPARRTRRIEQERRDDRRLRIGDAAALAQRRRRRRTRHRVRQQSFGYCRVTLKDDSAECIRARAFVPRVVQALRLSAEAPGRDEGFEDRRHVVVCKADAARTGALEAGNCCDEVRLGGGDELHI